MSCETEIKKRKTLPLTRILANKCRTLFSEDIAIYKVGENEYEFCGISAWNPQKGALAEVIPNRV